MNFDIRKSKGVFAIATTPFNEDGNIDFSSIDKLSDYYITSQVSGLTILGVMGEAPKLNLQEQKLVIERYIKNIGKQVPVIVGVSNPGLDNLISISNDAMELGASGVMVAGNNGLKNDDQIKSYFNQVSISLKNIPICLQDYPPTTNVYLSTSVIKDLFSNNENFLMFKHEDCPGHKKLSQLIEFRNLMNTSKFSILVGNGGIYVPQELKRGADGIMTGFAFTQMLVEVYNLFYKEDYEKGEDLFDLYLPLIRHEQQFGVGLAIRKEVLKLIGVITSSKVRSPGPILDKNDFIELDRLILRLKNKLEERKIPIPKGI